MPHNRIATVFRRLEILKYVEEETEAYVTFHALFDDGEMTERSRFLCENGVWFYVDGEMDGR